MYESIYYAELNGICFVLLAWIVIKLRQEVNKQLRNVLYLHVVYAAALLVAINIIWKYTNGREGSFFFCLNNGINVAYHTLTGVISFCWLRYVLCENPRDPFKKKWSAALCSLPFVFLAVCAAASPFTHWIFYIDRTTNLYHRGSAFIIQQIVAYGYYAAASIIAFVQMLRESNSLKRFQQRTIVLFIVLPLIAGVLSICLPGLDVIWQAVTISLLIGFADLQIAQISKDELTGLNNRRTFDAYINSAGSMNRGGKNAYLFMIDINLFKNINDRFGHTEGDAAIVRTADVLRGVFGPRSTLIARFCGDEFTVVYHCGSADEAEQARRDLYEAFDRVNSRPEARYKLTVSAGYARYESEKHTCAEELIKQADESMYEEKKRMHTLLK